MAGSKGIIFCAPPCGKACGKDYQNNLRTLLTFPRNYEKIDYQINHYHERSFMAHELEIDEATGQATFASLRQPAWHNLGTVFQDEVNTAEMLSLAKLDNWNVRLEEVPVPAGFTSDKTYSFVSRTNPFNKDMDRGLLDKVLQLINPGKAPEEVIQGTALETARLS